MAKKADIPERILVRAPNWIGDQVLAYPFFHFLRKAYPRARILSVCVEWVESVQFRGQVDETYVLPRPVQRTFSERLKLLEESARELRERGPWDLAISLPNSLSSAWLLYRSGAKRRRGYRADGRGLLLNDGLSWEAGSVRHRAQAYVDLLPDKARPSRDVLEFWGVPAENELDPDIPGELREFNVEREWPAEERIRAPEGPYWVLAPGATAESRRWALESFSALARRVASDTGWQGVVVGGPKEAGLAEILCADSSLKLIDRTARGGVAALAPLFRGARFTVTNESGLAHVAALCGSFVQIVCGAADPRRTRPVGPGKVQVAINPVDCWPCEKNTCWQVGGLKLQCLRGIQPDPVWEEIKRGIRWKP